MSRPTSRRLGGLMLGLLLAVYLEPSPAFAARSKGKGKARRAPAAAQARESSPDAASADKKNTLVAVLELTALGASSSDEGISRHVMQSLELLLRTNIASIDGFDVVPPVDLQMALQNPDNRQVAECGGGPRCAVETGRLVSADIVVFGAIGALGRQYSLGLRAVDVHTGNEIGRQQSMISGNRDDLIYEVLVAAFELMAPDKVRGSLVVDIDVDGVTVEIDGKEVGVTPLDRPVENLSPGNHVVVLRRAGFSQFQQEFHIRPFETAYLKLELAKQAQQNP